MRTIKRQGVAMGPLALRFITITVLALLTIVYLIQSTKGSSQQMQISSLSEKKEALQSERQEIELEAIRLRSLQQLKSTPTETFNLEPVKQAESMIGEQTR